jgi:hypothetical protein
MADTPRNRQATIFATLPSAWRSQVKAVLISEVVDRSYQSIANAQSEQLISGA